MPSVNINGDALEYAERGSGEPLVLVHGSASDYRTWRLQQDAFAKHFRTIAYSRRYHWPNRPIPDGVDYSMLEHVEDLKKVVHLLDAKPAHLVGHSYGASLCLLLTLREPHPARSLVLAEPPASLVGSQRQRCNLRLSTRTAGIARFIPTSPITAQ